MTGTPNPPIPGHHLLGEGSIFPVRQTFRFPYSSGDQPVADEFNGGCQCGAKPPGFPNLSRNAVKAWHREHKAEIRASAPKDEDELHHVDVVRLLHQVLDTAEGALRVGDHEKILKTILVWSQRREHLLAGEEKWEDEHV